MTYQLGAVAYQRPIMLTTAQRAALLPPVPITQAIPAPALPWNFPVVKPPPVVTATKPVPVSMPVVKPYVPTVSAAPSFSSASVSTAPSGSASPPLSFSSVFGGTAAGESSFGSGAASLLPIALVGVAAWFLLQPKKRRR